MKILFHMRADLGYGGITEDTINLFSLVADSAGVDELSTLILEHEYLEMSFKNNFRTRLRSYAYLVAKMVLPSFLKKLVKKRLLVKKGSQVSKIRLISNQELTPFIQHIEKRIGEERAGIFFKPQENKTSRRVWLNKTIGNIEHEDYPYVFFPFFTSPILWGKKATYLLRLHDICFITNPHHFDKNTFQVLKSSLDGALERENIFFICNSPYSKDSLEAYSSKAKERTYVVPCQVNRYQDEKDSLENLKKALKQNISNRYLSPCNHDKAVNLLTNIKEFVLVVGATHARKNYETLIEGWKIYKKENPNRAFPLVWVGYDCGKYEGTFIDEVTPFINKGEILHLDRLSREALNQLFFHASVFIVASYEEGFSIPPVEANQFGCPVIASDIPTHRWVMGDAAMFFNPKKAKALAQSIKELTSDADSNETVHALVEKGKKNAERFYKENVQKELSRVLEQIKQRTKV